MCFWSALRLIELTSGEYSNPMTDAMVSRPSSGRFLQLRCSLVTRNFFNCLMMCKHSLNLSSTNSVPQLNNVIWGCFFSSFCLSACLAKVVAWARSMFPIYLKKKKRKERNWRCWRWDEVNHILPPSHQTLKSSRLSKWGQKRSIFLLQDHKQHHKCAFNGSWCRIYISGENETHTSGCICTSNCHEESLEESHHLFIWDIH